MTETKDTKCPLCGAPAVVRISDDPFFVGSDCTPTRIAYEYDEPKPPVPKLYGYGIPHLTIVAKLLREHNVTPEDLHDMANNFESALNMVTEIQRRDMERHLHALQERCLGPEVFSAIMPGLNPLKITREQFDAIFKDKKEGQA